MPSGRLDGGHIHVDEMAIRAAERDAQSALLELVRHGLGVLDRSGPAIVLNCLVCASLKVSASAGKDMDVRSALLAGEDGLVDLLGNRRVGGQQHCAARAVETLVRGGHDHMGNANRRRHHARRHQSADVRNIRQEVRADFIGDLAELLPIRNP